MSVPGREGRSRWGGEAAPCGSVGTCSSTEGGQAVGPGLSWGLLCFPGRGEQCGRRVIGGGVVVFPLLCVWGVVVRVKAASFSTITVLLYM